MATHYGTVIIPARPHKPRDKAKVENAVQVVERWILAPLRNRTFSVNGGCTLERTAMMRFVHHKRLGMRFCPECVAESNHWSLWQLRMVTTCLRHRQLLVERCWDCSKAITIQTLRSGRCQCGAAVIRCDGMAAPAGERGLDAQNTIQNLLFGLRPVADGLESPVWFASLDFFQRWMSGFPPGSLSVDGMTTQTKPEHRRKFWEPVEIDHVHYALATEILHQGQSGFNRLCREWLAVRRSYRKWATGFHRDFARLHQLLSDFPNASFSHLHEWVSAFLEHEWAGGYPSRVHRVEKGTLKRLPLDQAATMLQCRTHNVVLMVKNGLLHGGLLPLSVDGIVRGLVTSASVGQAVKMRAEAVPLQTAAAVTGLGPWLLRQLCLSGILQADRGPMADGTEEILIHRTRLDALVEALSTGNCTARPDMVPLRQFNLNTATDLIGEILSGQRAAHVRTTGGRIREILVGDRTKDAALGADSQTGEVTLVSAATSLGISEPLIRVLAVHGLLDIADGMVRGCGEFRRSYCWESEAGRVLGISAITLRRWATWGRISPAFAIGRCPLYRQADLLPFAPRSRCTVKEAGHLLGCHPQDVRRYYIARGKLDPFGGPGVDGGCETILSLPAVLALAREQPPLFDPGEPLVSTCADIQKITTQEAANILGLTVSQFQARYRRSDVLVPVGRLPGGRQCLFHREDVERFRKQD